MSTRPNWFVAFPVPGDGWLAPALATLPAGLRAFGESDLHATIAFLGTVDAERARRAWDVVRASAARVSSVEVTLAGLAPMGDPRRYSALSALLGGGREVVARTIGSLRDPILDAAGARRDDRPPKPHVTIARPGRHTTEAERAAALVWARGVELGAPRVTLDRIALYTWSEDRRARLFRIVDELALGRG